MGPEQRLELIDALLDSAPLTTGVLGREIAAAHALARGEDLETVKDRLAEAELVGSGKACACLQRIFPSKDSDRPPNLRL